MALKVSIWGWVNWIGGETRNRNGSVVGASVYIVLLFIELLMKKENSKAFLHRWLHVCFKLCITCFNMRTHKKIGAENLK
jgi:hypothetical protein